MTAAEFIKSLPAKATPEALEDMDTNFFFDIEGEGGGEFTLIAKDGELTLHEGRQGEAKCEVKAKNDNFMSVIKGESNPMMAVMTGKLKIKNTGELLKYAKVFGLM